MKSRMRKRYRVLLIAVMIAAAAVPLGFALSSESAPPIAAPMMRTSVAATVITEPALVTTAPTGESFLHTVPDAAKLFGIGTALFGRAAALRRAA